MESCESLRWCRSRKWKLCLKALKLKLDYGAVALDSIRYLLDFGRMMRVNSSSYADSLLNSLKRLC